MYPCCMAVGVLPCLLDFGWGVLLLGERIVKTFLSDKTPEKTTKGEKGLFRLTVSRVSVLAERMC